MGLLDGLEVVGHSAQDEVVPSQLVLDGYCLSQAVVGVAGCSMGLALVPAA